MDGAFWAALGAIGWEPAAIGMLVVVLGLFLRAVLTGRLVPRAVLEDVRSDRDDRIREIGADRDYLRQALNVSEETRAVMAKQVERLLSTSELTNQLLLSLKDRSQP